MNAYNPKEIEVKWQKIWEDEKLFQTPRDVTKENKVYILPQLPYPSGSGLHVGHAEVYTACDIYARYLRMSGKKVLQVMGWDAFGLPAENYAIKTNVHPRKSTNDAIDNFRSQIKALGISVDWDREVGSHNPDYYKWTQWFFLLMYERGLAYRKKQAVNWCESCKTVLANEQVTADGKCERCDTVVVQRDMEQWYLKITEYADKLLEGLDRIDWPEETKKRQRDWIGRSEGATVKFSIFNFQFSIEVFTTRPDTIFGATYLVIAPEHPFVVQSQEFIVNSDEVNRYVEATKLKTDLDRQVQTEKTGVELKGVKAINPATGEEIPIWVADFVLASYGTGAIMAVPAHDERDGEFAKKFGLPMKQVVAPYIEMSGVATPRPDKPVSKKNVTSAIIQHANTKQFLLLSWPTGAVGLVGGGIDGDETPEQAIKREIAEETGYTNVRIHSGVLPDIYSKGFKARKDTNCFDFDTAFFVEVLDDSRIDIREEDKNAHNVFWVDEKDVLQKMTNDHHRFLWNVYVEKQLCFTGGGIAINSDFLNGLNTPEAKQKAIAWLEEQGIGQKKVQYKLRDWSVSRQRFWGAPIPMLYDEKGGLHPVPKEDLPVILPDDVDFKPTGQSPLTYSEAFQKGVEEKYGKGWHREPDTLDTFMCSSWYYYRYLDPKNEHEFASPESLKTWMPVDFYLGGAEHVNGHLLYSRFFTKVLYDAGYIDFDEPFTKHRHQGLILGEDNRKMSKRWGNVINPTDVIAEYGADTMRTYEMFMGPLEQTKPWDTNGVRGVRRFFDRVWNLQSKLTDHDSQIPNFQFPISKQNSKIQTLIHQTIKKVTEDVASMRFNTAIAKMMETLNELAKEETIAKDVYRNFILLLSPFAPHMAEELWHMLGEKQSIAFAKWPAYDPALIVSDTMTIVVQVNGKMRDSIDLSSDATEDTVKSTVLSSEKIQKYLEGKEPKKVIYVPGKIVSIVV